MVGVSLQLSSAVVGTALQLCGLGLHSVMKHFLLGAFLLCGTTFADSRVLGTNVSYKVKKEALGGTNASMIFVDALEDKSGKTYVTFTCDLGSMFFSIYSKSALVMRVAEDIGIIYRGDNFTMRDALGQAREDRQTGKLSVVQFIESTSADVLKLFLVSKKVVIRIERESMSSVTYTFPTKGFYKAYASVKGCE